MKSKNLVLEQAGCKSDRSKDLLPVPYLNLVLGLQV